MYKKEINVDNVVEFLNSYDYTDSQLTASWNNPKRFRLRDYERVTEDMVNHFFDTYTKVDLEKYPVSEYNPKFILLHNSPSLICDRVIDKLVKDISKIEFTSFYPNIILKLYEMGEVKFNVEEYHELYKFMVDNQQEIEKHKDSVKVTKSLLRTIKNMLYLASGQIDNDVIKIDRVDKVIGYYSDVYLKLFSENINIVHIDVDDIYYQKMNDDKIEESIKELDLPYTITDDLSGYFFAKKKYIIDDGHGLTCRGVNIKDTGRLRKNSKQEKIKNIYNKMNINLRKRKIEKIKDGI